MEYTFFLQVVRCFCLLLVPVSTCSGILSSAAAGSGRSLRVVGALPRGEEHTFFLQVVRCFCLLLVPVSTCSGILSSAAAGSGRSLRVVGALPRGEAHTGSGRHTALPGGIAELQLSLIHISEPTSLGMIS